MLKIVKHKKVFHQKILVVTIPKFYHHYRTTNLFLSINDVEDPKKSSNSSNISNLDNEILDKLYDKIREKREIQDKINEQAEDTQRKLTPDFTGDVRRQKYTTGAGSSIGDSSTPMTSFLGNIVDPIKIDMEQLKNDKDFDYDYFKEKKKLIDQHYEISIPPLWPSLRWYQWILFFIFAEVLSMIWEQFHLAYLRQRGPMMRRTVEMGLLTKQLEEEELWESVIAKRRNKVKVT